MDLLGLGVRRMVAGTDRPDGLVGDHDPLRVVHRRRQQFDQIILKTAANGQITRIRDVGRVELGARSYSQVFRMDGRPAGGIAIYQLPGANALDTAKGVRKLLASLAPGFPQGLVYEVPFDTTTFVRESVTEV